MFLFLRLLLAHFVADFPLQTARVYLLKAGGGLGKWAHTLIIFATSVLFVYPYWACSDTWIYLLGSTLVHHLSDWIKVELNRKGSPRYFLLRYIADQIVHVATAAFVFLMPLGQLRLAWPSEGRCEFWRLWADWYDSDFWMLYGSLLIVATYFATYFIESFKKSYAPERFQPVLPEAYKYYGILERACLFHLAFVGGLFWALTPLAILPRFAMARLWPAHFAKLRCASILEISLSVILGILPGIALRLLQSKAF